MGGCAGSLVAPDAVLFAAHCGDRTGAKLNIGAYKRGVVKKGKQRFCDKWVEDPTYGEGGSGLNNDFALCKLNKPVTIDESKVKLVLNEADTVPAAEANLIVMGLGLLAYGGDAPDFLHDVTVPTISNQDCNTASSYGGHVTDRMLCAGFPEGGKDACQGDSGGPIVKREYQGDGTFIDIQVGVVSWGAGCAEPNKPGVYSRVSSRSTWIKRTICNDFNSAASFCYLPFDVPTDSHIEFPTETPTESPTAFPTYFPTYFPTGFQTFDPTDFPTESCVDDADFKYKNRKKKNCRWVGRGKNKKVKNKCKRTWGVGSDNKSLYDWCPETCGKKAGLGRCSHLKN